MTRIMISDAFANQVSGLTSTVEVCDASGQVLGIFTPRAAEDISACHDVVSPLSEAEVKRRLAEPGGRSLAEIWKTLEPR